MGLEFGRPTSPEQALTRIPDGSHPNFQDPENEDVPYQAVAHFREFVEGFVKMCESGEAARTILEDRMEPMETDDLRLLFQLDSFYRDLKTSSTYEWSAINPESQWAYYFPSGDGDYRWWQITALDPDVRCGPYRLYCIEINSRFFPIDSKVRFDDNSEFEMMFATEEEINSLKEALEKSLS